MFKKGSPPLLENYRPTSLLNSLYKIYATILRGRVVAAAEHHMQVTQYGFRARRCTAQPLFCVWRILNMPERAGAKGIMVFLDWSKALDRIRHDVLWDSMSEHSVEPRLSAAVKSLYVEPKFRVRARDVSSSWKVQRRGIRQGCPLSPHLLDLAMPSLWQKVRMTAAERGVQAGLWVSDFWDLSYADDTVFMAETEDSAEGLLRFPEQGALTSGLRLNTATCEALSLRPWRQMFRYRGRGKHERQRQISGMQRLWLWARKLADAHWGSPQKLAECGSVLEQFGVLQKMATNNLRCCHSLQTCTRLVKGSLDAGADEALRRLPDAWDPSNSRGPAPLRRP